MDSPYTPPESSAPGLDKLARSKRFFVWAAFVCGVGVVLPPLFGMLGMVIGMGGAFAELQQTGSADPSALAGDISFAMLTTLWGLVFSALSLIPFVVFLALYLRRKKTLAGIATGMDDAANGKIG